MTEPSPSTPGQRRIAAAVLLAGVVCMGMGQTIIFAILPPLARRIGLLDQQVLSIFMLSAFFWVVIGPIWGRQSDHNGRRRYIILGLSGFAVSMTLFATVIQYGLNGTITGLSLYFLLIVTRSIYGLIGSATPASAQAYIADRTPPNKRTAGMAGFSAAFGFGAMIGPAFGGAAAVLSPLAPLYAVAGLAACAALAVIFLLPEKTPPKERDERPKLSAFDPRIRSYLIYGLATAIAMAIPTQFIGFYMIDRLHLSDSDALQYVGIALSAAAMASLFSQLVLVQHFKFGPSTLMRAGPVLIFLGHAIVALSSSLGPIAFGMLLAGLGSGMVMPGFVGGASLSVTRKEQGAVAGLSNSAAASSFIIAPLIGFTLYRIDPRALFVATSLIAASTAIYASLDSRLRSSAGGEV